MDKYEYEADIHLFWSDEDEGFISTVFMLRQAGKPIIGDFIGISACGDTVEDSLRELGVALTMALEVREEDTP